MASIAIHAKLHQWTSCRKIFFDEWIVWRLVLSHGDRNNVSLPDLPENCTVSRYEAFHRNILDPSTCMYDTHSRSGVVGMSAYEPERGYVGRRT